MNLFILGWDQFYRWQWKEECKMAREGFKEGGFTLNVNWLLWSRPVHETTFVEYQREPSGFDGGIP